MEITNHPNILFVLNFFYATGVIKTIQRIKWKPGFGKTNRPIPGSKNYHFQNEVDVQNLTYENEFYLHE